MIQLNQVAPMDEVWLVNNTTYYAVRYLENTSPPVPIVWEIRGEQVEATGAAEHVTHRISREAFRKTGALFQGTSIELVNVKEDPLEILYSNYEDEVRVKPWLADPEILAIWAASALEGRSITDAELQNTEWWRTHTDAERQWISQNAADPATADRLIEDNRVRVAELFEQAGVDNAPEALVQSVADNWTQGAWSEIYAINQIQLLADPNLKGTRDPTLSAFGPRLDTTREGEGDVRNMISTWLGPRAAADWSDDSIAKWGSMFRDDPDARLQLERTLSQHRKALFPEYEDATLTYEDIAAPWRGVWAGILGGTADELDPLFSKIVRLNDRATAESLLRKEGLKQGNATVAQTLLSDLQQSFGGQVRRSDPAVL